MWVCAWRGGEREGGREAGSAGGYDWGAGASTQRLHPQTPNNQPSCHQATALERSGHILILAKLWTLNSRQMSHRRDNKLPWISVWAVNLRAVLLASSGGLSCANGWWKIKNKALEALWGAMNKAGTPYAEALRSLLQSALVQILHWAQKIITALNPTKWSVYCLYLVLQCMHL